MILCNILDHQDDRIGLLCPQGGVQSARGYSKEIGTQIFEELKTGCTRYGCMGGPCLGA
jgi:hypothetical protein